MQLWTIILADLAPLVLGAAVTVGIWLAAGRRLGGLRGQAGILAAIGGLVPVAVSALYTVIGVMQLLSPMTGEAAVSFFGARFVTPLGAGIVALVILSVPRGRRPRSSSGTIVRRTAFSFLAPRWAVAAIASVGVTVAVSVAAGLASEPDHNGHYAITTFRSGTMGAFISIYGWYYSVPAIIMLAALLGIAWAGLALTARPALGDAREEDVAVRRVRSRNIAAVVTGTVAFHLSAILESLAGSSSVRESFPTDSAGTVTIWSPFAALGGFLSVSSIACIVLGAALCVGVILTAVPTADRARQATVKNAP